MMRIGDSREAGLLNAFTECSSLETTRHVCTEFDDGAVGKGWRGMKRGYAVRVCVVLVAIAAIVCVTVVIGMRTGGGSSKHDGIEDEPQSGPQGFAPAPGPRGSTGLGAITGWVSSSAGPAVDPTEPAAAPSLISPLSSTIPAPLAVIDPSSASPSLDLALYETICNKTINRVDCLNMFRSNPKSHGGDLKQWTVMAMEAAEHALNESYILAQGMKKENEGNVALQQCIDVFADALGNVNTSIFLVSTMDRQNPGKTGEDVQTFMSAAMTNYDTCGEGVDDIGSFPESDKITGRQAKHVDTMLSIALTFVNHLTAPMTDRYHHRRLLHVKPTGSGRIMASFSGIPSKIGQVFPR